MATREQLGGERAGTSAAVTNDSGTQEPASAQEHEQRVQERQWIERCVRGEQAAFHALYRQHAPAIYRQLRALLGPSSDLDDTLQAVFIQAFGNIARFDFRTRFSSWLRGVAVKVALNKMRSRQRQKVALTALVQDTSHAPRSAPTPESRVALAQRAMQLDHHMEKLSPDKRAALLMYYVEQCELKEVADRLNTTPVKVWARIKRARLELLRAIAREERGRSARLRSTS